MQTLEHLAHSTFTPIFYWGPEPWINKLRHEKGFAWTHLCCCYFCCCCCCCCYIVIWKISFHNKLIAHRELGWLWHWFLNHLPRLTPFVKRDTRQVNKWKEKFGRLGKEMVIIVHTWGEGGVRQLLDWSSLDPSQKENPLKRSLLSRHLKATVACGGAV